MNCCKPHHHTFLHAHTHTETHTTVLQTAAAPINMPHSNAARQTVQKIDLAEEAAAIFCHCSSWSEQIGSPSLRLDAPLRERGQAERHLTAPESHLDPCVAWN